MKSEDLIDAVKAGSSRRVKELLKRNWWHRLFGNKLDLNETIDAKGTTALHLATANGDVQVAQALIDGGASVSGAGGGFFTPLHWAAQYNQVETATLLIERGANLDAQGWHGGSYGTGSTPLHWAAEEDSLECATLLLQRGADCNTKNEYGYTPLHLAAIQCKPRIAKLLVSKGAEIDARAKWDETPFWEAARKEHGGLAVAKLLWAAGADPDATCKHGGENTPRSCARKWAAGGNAGWQELVAAFGRRNKPRST